VILGVVIGVGLALGVGDDDGVTLGVGLTLALGVGLTLGVGVLKKQPFADVHGGDTGVVGGTYVFTKPQYQTSPPRRNGVIVWLLSPQLSLVVGLVEHPPRDAT